MKQTSCKGLNSPLWMLYSRHHDTVTKYNNCSGIVDEHGYVHVQSFMFTITWNRNRLPFWRIWVPRLLICLCIYTMVPIIRFSPATFMCLSKFSMWIPNTICRGILCGHWFEGRDVYLFCWYWYNCWPSIWTYCSDSVVCFVFNFIIS